MNKAEKAFEVWATTDTVAAKSVGTVHDRWLRQVWLAAWAARRALDAAIAYEEKHKHDLKDGEVSDDPDYDQGYYEAAFEIMTRIKECS